MPLRLPVLLLAAALAACAAPEPAPVPAARITPSPPATTPGGERPPATPSPDRPAPSPTPAPPPPASAHPAASVYPTQQHGYDASYPQCSSGHVPAGAAFSVVGVNGGKAFTTNPCLGRQWRAAGGPRGLYLNSGYNPDNLSKTTSDCRDLAAKLSATGDERNAYAIGCGEAVYSLGAARNAGAADPLMWWIDVESTNSWDDVDLNLNRFALQGQIDQLTALGRPVGIYSTFKDWLFVTGAWTTPAIVADWVAGLSPAAACTVPGFSGAAVWLAQERATWSDGSGIDSDWSC